MIWISSNVVCSCRRRCLGDVVFSKSRIRPAYWMSDQDMETGDTVCINVLPAISRDLWRPSAVEICSVRKGAIMTRRRGAGPYPNAKHIIANSGVRRIVAGINSRI